MLVSIRGNPSIKLPVWLQSSNPDFPNNLDHYQTVLEDGLRHLKQKYPQFKYLESQNEPGGEIKVTADQFKLMHERVQLAANTVNRELPANVPKLSLAVRAWDTAPGHGNKIRVFGAHP